MRSDLSRLFERSREWLRDAAERGWLAPDTLSAFDRIERGGSDELFREPHARPLVVALFGGTGVGKSSLLNRIAGESIARAGVERPTSREVTLYVHNSVRMADLPAEWPTGQVCVERHHADPWRDVVWIDAPDIDSTIEQNRRLAFACLPHVDLLIYVVSPERYRDDVGWRTLLARGHRHGWLFVLNRWDEGDPQQREDLRGMLRHAGFEEPMLLCTTALRGGARTPTPDEFAQIERVLSAVLAEHGVRELTRLGQRARLAELRTMLQAAGARLGAEQSWEQLRSSLAQQWQRAEQSLLEGTEWSMGAAAAQLAARERRLVGESSGSLPAVIRRAAGVMSESLKPAETPGQTGDADLLAQLTGGLWDDWSQQRVSACLDAVELDARRSGFSPAPIRQALDRAASTARDVVLQPVHAGVRSALARPGAAWQRSLRRVTGALVVAAPFAATLWVGQRVVVAFYHAGSTSTPYLDSSFAVHAGLLVLVAWGAPFCLHQLLRPSLQQSLLDALRRALADGLAGIGRQLEEGLASVGREAEALCREQREITAEIDRLLGSSSPDFGPVLSRLIAGPAAAAEPAPR